jgi:hypothetical protein
MQRGAHCSSRGRCRHALDRAEDLGPTGEPGAIDEANQVSRGCALLYHDLDQVCRNQLFDGVSDRVRFQAEVIDKFLGGARPSLQGNEDGQPVRMAHANEDRGDVSRDSGGG